MAGLRSPQGGLNQLASNARGPPEPEGPKIRSFIAAKKELHDLYGGFKYMSTKRGIPTDAPEAAGLSQEGADDEA